VGIKTIPDFRVKRHDNAPKKRVELHCHTKMSDMDGVSSAGDIVAQAYEWGMPGIAITDHGVVQAFPAVFNTSKKLKVGDSEEPFKSILGVEGYVVDDGPTIFYNLPFIPGKDSGLPKPPMAVGEFVSIAIQTNGDDPCKDTFTRVAASKF
jgi:DNA polymerase III alpha subunit (gram-positive type)